jgi:Domain of unknown function (DUF4041)/Meiotically up-regulated gene 113
VLIALSIAVGIGIVAIVAVILTRQRLLRVTSERDEWRTQHAALMERFRPVVDAEAERERILDAVERDRIVAEATLEQRRAALASDEVRMREAIEARRIAEAAAMERERAALHAEQAAVRMEIGVERAAAVRTLEELEQKRALEANTIATLHGQIAALRAEFAVLDEESNLQAFGFYKPRYSFAESRHYQERLEQVLAQQKEMLRAKNAAVCAAEWLVNGSKVEGRKQTNQTLKLMLRAFNGESDAAVAKVRYNNVHVMEARIRKAFEAINGLAEVQQCCIVDAYLELKLQELYLSHEYENKLEAEKDEQRRIREQMRDEEIAQRELERAKAEAEREEARYEQALAKAREEIESAAGAKQERLHQKIEELQERLAEAHANKERAIARAQMTRSGHVYVISNLGSFGEHVYKIGMTRRLDPMDRIRELGDASVPFQFDVHAIIYSDDAPALECELHKAFDGQRVNRVNERKEFFRVPIEQIARTVREQRGDIEITLTAEAAEYRKTQAILAESAVGAARLPIAAGALSAASAMEGEVRSSSLILGVEHDSAMANADRGQR